MYWDWESVKWILSLRDKAGVDCGFIKTNSISMVLKAMELSTRQMCHGRVSWVFTFSIIPRY